MDWEVRNMTLEDAQIVCTWRYPDNLSVYDYPCWEEMVRSGQGLGVASVREKEFWAVIQGGELIGHFRLAEKEDCVMVGLGLAPQWCGKGLGSVFIETIKRQAGKQYPGKRLRLLVRTFNKRAIRSYEKAGFVGGEIKRFITPTGPADMLVMECPPCPVSFLKE